MYITNLSNYYEESSAASTIIYGITMTYIINIVFFGLNMKVIRKCDKYIQWKQENPITEKIIIVAALISTFQFYRIIFVGVGVLDIENKIIDEDVENENKKEKGTITNTK